MILPTPTHTERERERRNEFSKLVGYKINTQKSLAHLNTSNKQFKKYFKKSFHLYNIKKNKLLRNEFNQGSLRLIY